MPDTPNFNDAVVQYLFQTLGFRALITIALGISLYLLLKFYLIPSEVNKKTAKIKSALEKEQFIHRLQFEKEFEIYLELWKKLFVLKEATEMLVLVVDYDEPGLTEEETRKIRLERAEKAYNEVQTAINHYRPFFAKDVYKNAKKILDKSLRQVLTSQYPGKNIEEVLKSFEKAQSRTKNILKVIDEIEKAIRHRIFDIGEAELIE